MKSEWREFRLGDIAEWASGGTPSKKNADFWNGTIPWISASSMVSNRYSESDLKITQEGLKAGSRLAKKDSILLLVRGSTLHQRIPVGITTLDVSFNQDVKAIKAKEEFIDPWYLLFWFMAKEKDLLNMVENTGIGAGKLDTKRLQDMLIKIPPDAERNKIRLFAKALDDKLWINRKINQTLESMAQAIFKSWFVDFEPVKAKIAAIVAGEDAEGVTCAAMRTISSKTDDELDQMQAGQPEHYAQLKTTAELFPSAMQDSELGEVPEGWEVRTVGDVVNRLKSKKRYTKKQVMLYGRVPVLEQGADIILGYHDDEAGFTASPDKSIFIFGDHTCITYLSCQPFDISQNVIPLEGNKLPTVWVYYAVKDLQSFQEYRRHWSEFSIKKVIVPIKVLSEVFSELATSFYKNKEKNIDQNAKLSQLCDHLLPKLLSGELSVDALKITNEHGE